MDTSGDKVKKVDARWREQGKERKKKREEKI